MGTRPGDAFNIKKSDIGKSVLKKRSKVGTEWWIYRKKDSRFIDTFGKQLKDNDTYLYCIILCDETNDGIRVQNEEFIAVEGIKFTNDEKGKDLDDYIYKSKNA